MPASHRLPDGTEGDVRRLAFHHYLRTGEVLGARALQALRREPEVKFNPNHDPATGRFTSGPGGPGGTHPRLPGSDPSQKAFYYQGVTAHGVGRIEPTSGGYVRADGRYVPEVFPPDPYAIKDAAGALSRYMDGSGDPLNFYMNDVDTSRLEIEKFEKIQERLVAGYPGVYQISNSTAGIDTYDPSSSTHFTAATVIGGLAVTTTGTLTIDQNGRYKFDGWLGAPGDIYMSHSRAGRTAAGDFLNNVLGAIPGKPFPIYIVGTKPFIRSGSVHER